MAAPYDSVLSCLNIAIVRLNDAMKQAQGAPVNQIGGEIVGAQQIFSQTAVNAAWRRLQEFLVSQQFSRLINTVILPNIPATATTDPAVLCFIDWDGYFDGNTVQTSPVLPANLMTPLRLKERVTGAIDAGAQFTPMEYIINGISGDVKRNRNYNWAWDNDALYFNGSTVPMDLELRYAIFLGDFEDGSPAVNWYDNVVPIVRSQDALAWYICSEFANARGDMDGAAFDAKAEAAALKLVTREQQNDQLRSEWTIPDIPAQTGATPYDYASTILNMARTRLNSVNKIAADVIASNQPFTQRIFNNAYRKLQEYLANMGYQAMTDTVVIEGLTPKLGTDPAVQVFIDWNGYFDGQSVNTSIVLPQNFIYPLKMEWRINGQNALFSPIEILIDGIPTISQQAANWWADWRSNAIYMPGANQTMDLRIRYVKLLPDIVETNVPSGGGA